jgi:hypothetical protein
VEERGGTPMSLLHVELDRNVNENAFRNPNVWNAAETPKTPSWVAPETLNARLVEFIAKPGKVELLEEFVRGQIMEFLSRQRGFAGAIILNSHQEQRLILVVSLWATKRMSEENCWERSRVVRQVVGCLIDVCSRVHTYEAGFAKASGEEHESASVWTLGQEVQE